MTENILDQQQLLDKPGPHKTSKACLYTKKLKQVDLTILEQLMAKSIAATTVKHPH